MILLCLLNFSVASTFKGCLEFGKQDLYFKPYIEKKICIFFGPSDKYSSHFRFVWFLVFYQSS